MKKKLLVTGLVCSAVVNVVGVVLLISYLNLLGHFKMASLEIAQLATNLTFAQTANVVTQLASPDKVDKRAFISKFDHQEDFMAVEPIALPNKTEEATLFVFFHGMGASCLEPFATPKDTPISDAIVKKDHSYVLMAPNYRSPAGWVSDAALSDITQCIHMMCVQYPIKHIVLVGTSMGGCVALSYSVLAPDDIKKKLQGVVAIDAAGNYADLYQKTKLDAARFTLAQCFGGPPDKVTVAYAAKSFLPISAGLPGQARIALISARQDTTVPPALQDEIYNTLKAQGRPVTLIPVDMEHGCPPIPIVMKAVDFVLESQKSDESDNKKTD